jgi:hypothetical protein
MTEFNVGDTVVATKGTTRIEAVLVRNPYSDDNPLLEYTGGYTAKGIWDRGFDVKVTKPAIVLPVEQGWYQSDRFPISKMGVPYELQDNGRWYLNGEEIAKERMRLNGPYSKIDTVTDTAKRVLDRLAEIDRAGGAMTCSFTAGHIKQLSKEFGVLSE